MVRLQVGFNLFPRASQNPLGQSLDHLFPSILLPKPPETSFPSRGEEQVFVLKPLGDSLALLEPAPQAHISPPHCALHYCFAGDILERMKRVWTNAPDLTGVGWGVMVGKVSTPQPDLWTQCPSDLSRLVPKLSCSALRSSAPTYPSLLEPQLLAEGW